VGKRRERTESVIKKRRETTDRCGKKVEGTESVFKKGRELEKYIYFLNGKGNQLLINRIMVHYMWVLWTLSHQKIALNRGFPMVPLPLNFIQPLRSYNRKTIWVLCGKNWVPWRSGFFSLSFDS